MVLTFRPEWYKVNYVVIFFLFSQSHRIQHSYVPHHAAPCAWYAEEEAAEAAAHRNLRHLTKRVEVSRGGGSGRAVYRVRSVCSRLESLSEVCRCNRNNAEN